MVRDRVGADEAHPSVVIFFIRSSRGGRGGSLSLLLQHNCLSRGSGDVLLSSRV